MKALKKYYHRLSLKQKFMSIYSCVTLLFVLTILAAQLFYTRYQTNQVVSMKQDTLRLQMNALDDQLEDTAGFLKTFLLMDYDKELLEAKDQDEIVDAQRSINERLQEQISLNSEISGLALYAPATETFLIQTQGQETFTDRLEIQEYLKSYYLASGPSATPSIESWQPVMIGKHVFLMTVARYERVYIASWYRVDRVLAPLEKLEENSKSRYYLSESSGESSTLYTADSETIDSAERETLEKTYLPVSVTSQKYGYTLWSLHPRSTLLSGYRQYSLLLGILLLVICLGLMIFLIFIRRDILQPVGVITKGMKELEKGDLEMQLAVPENEDEFSEMMQTFNYMTQEIRHLKIRVYEEQLAHMHTELEYLTLQIKPHFFLNCLNVIYSLSLSKKTEAITRMASYMIVYFRYLFKNSSTMVSVREELEHARMYLNIQEMRSYSEFAIDFQVAPELEEKQIPVLSLQTFVENIFKHAFQRTEEILVEVHVEAADAEDLRQRKSPLPSGFEPLPVPYMRIMIHDNGSGFPEDQLGPLNDMTNLAHTEKGHVGISNVKHRLLHMYGTHMQMEFRNAPQGGAVVEMLLPQQRVPSDYSGEEP